MDEVAAGFARGALENGIHARALWETLKILRPSQNKNAIVWTVIAQTFSRLADLWEEAVSLEKAEQLNTALLEDILFIVDHLWDQDVAPLQDRVNSYLAKIDAEFGVD